MEALIAELEAATEGSRELDYAIAKKIGWRFHGGKDFKEYGFLWRDATTDEWKQLPWWTTSLDAALTLVPEADLKYGIEIYASTGRDKNGCDFPSGQYKNWIQVREAATPALALCIAALRAHQAMEAA